MSEYFLTGGTGVVGSAIARELLTRLGARVNILVRAESEDELPARLGTLLQFWMLDPDSVRGRIELLRGDTTQPRFGLDAKAFDRLAARCSHVIHCAALVKMNLPLVEARKSALVAAENIVQFSRASQLRGALQKVEFLSTVGVGGHWVGALPERRIEEARTFHNTYEQAKAEAEALVHERIAEGLPITVHRPSMVVGDSKSGRVIRFQIFYHLVEFLTGERTFGLFPSFGPTRLDVVPVDYVAAAVVWSSQQAMTIGRVLHLCSGPAGSVSIVALQCQIRDLWRSHGAKLPGVMHIPLGWFRAALPLIRICSPPSLRRAIESLPIFLEYLAESQTFENTASRALLERHGIMLPRVESYLHRVLAYYLSRADRMKAASEKTAGQTDARRLP